MSSTLDRYCEHDIPLIDGPRGARVAASTLKAIAATFAVAPRLIEVAPKVWNLVGIGISSRMMVEAPEGLVIFDTGDDLDDGERALAEFRKVSDRPIKAIVYSHNHYAHGTQAFTREAPDAMIIGHHQVNRHLAEISTGFASGGEFPEAVPALTARYERQFALHLPQQGPDTGLAAIIPPGRAKGTAPATHLVHDGDELMVAGLRMQFFTEHFSDSEDTLTAWVPEMKLVYNNFLWPSLFNFYTLRGDVFRNPASWRNGLKLIRDLEPEVLVNTHALPYIGKHEVRQALELYMDAISFMIDQTLRGINKGLSPDDLKEFVKLPPHLRDFANNSESYSEFFYFPLHLYNHIFGWFDGDAASIHRLAADDEARRIVAGFGGAEQVLIQYHNAMAQGDLVWASRLAGWLLATDRESNVFREAQAEALRQIAYRAPGTIPRHFNLTQALELERKITPVRSVLPDMPAIRAVEPARYVDFLRVRLDPARSAEVQQRLVIEITDKGVSHALQVRRGVCEFQRDPGATAQGDLSLRLDHEAWAEYYVGQTSIEALLESGRATCNRSDDLVRFFALFDDAQQSINPDFAGIRRGVAA
ncbi:alkyl sulfatase dimerization domain-containing protein [Paraburkholderia flagellata]|uniref:alkyl sulfatase dimerization domain-containing protein n=1 Tax=Paraburkholderia flagellata TaxID=2883241 RepID=UPI001F3A6A04|nr:alkyl sulfatase dimerization domain-containing protein [Paraburkholderia flagellata]